MTKPILFKLWRTILPIIFIFVLIHFAKDITQDILQVNTFLDVFGDAHEDLSFLPEPIPTVFTYWLGGLSILVELFLLISIPIVLKRKKFSKLEKYVVMCTIFLFSFLGLCVLLDPKTTRFIGSP